MPHSGSKCAVTLVLKEKKLKLQVLLLFIVKWADIVYKEICFSFLTFLTGFVIL